MVAVVVGELTLLALEDLEVAMPLMLVVVEVAQALVKPQV
jgi:hypothetical protein